MGRVWIFSDSHYGHKNICSGLTDWNPGSAGLRPFNNIYELNEDLVNNINKYVDQDDELFFLGDWSFGGIENIYTFRSRINCKIIYFLPGNHDKHIIQNRRIESCDRLAQDLFTLILPSMFTYSYKDQLFIMSHFPFQEWLHMDKGSIHLHGHTHHSIDNDALNTIYRRKDVGWEGKPYLLDDIIEEMKDRKIKLRYKND